MRRYFGDTWIGQNRRKYRISYKNDNFKVGVPNGASLKDLESLFKYFLGTQGEACHKTTLSM